jgi:SEC-C motif-containing protein
MENCPCSSGLEYTKCCEPYITGAKTAPTAESLMRSRYTAYVVHAIEYIINTCLEGDKIIRESVEAWSNNSEWLGLRIITIIGGGMDDNIGKVVFEAIYEQKGLRYVHHETASFIKKNSCWFYEDGEIEPQTVVRNGSKVGRNDPCVCGSGKKYKHCCGK